MLIWTGLLDPRKPVVLVGGVMAAALFMDAANGAAVSTNASAGLCSALTVIFLSVLAGTPRQPTIQRSHERIGRCYRQHGRCPFLRWLSIHKVSPGGERSTSRTAWLTLTSSSYHKGTWIIGVVAVAIGVLMTVVKPIPKKQLLAGGYMSQ
jgi:hypothetical protein